MPFWFWLAKSNNWSGLSGSPKSIFSTWCWNAQGSMLSLELNTSPVRPWAQIRQCLPSLSGSHLYEVFLPFIIIHSQGKSNFFHNLKSNVYLLWHLPAFGWVLAWKTGKFSSSELSAINYHYFISQPLCLFLFFSYFSLVTKLHKAFWDSKLL